MTDNDQPITPLVAQIIEQNSRDLAHTTNALLDSYKEQRDTAQATLAAIRDRVDELFNGPYQPSAAAVLNALYPDRATINEYRKAQS